MRNEASEAKSLLSGVKSRRMTGNKKQIMRLGLVIWVLGVIFIGLGAKCPWTKEKEKIVYVTGSSGSVPVAPFILGAVGTFDPLPDFSLLYVTLEWTDHSDNEDGFSIEIKEGATLTAFGRAEWGVIATVGRDMTFYVDDRPPRLWRAYRVRSYNSVGYSAYSNIDYSWQ